jgi:protein arginine N-methyltransferase 1
VYSIMGYGEMIADSVRMDAYVRALRRVVKPGSVVLDIGTGTGIFALLACRFGARRVYAVEPSDAIHVAREIASANGCAGSIEFFQTISSEVSLPELADVIISDLRGVLPLHQHHLTSIADARRRLLVPGGVLIPARDTLWAACVEAPELYRDIESPWSDNTYGLDMQAGRRLVSNAWCKANLKSEQMLTEPEHWATLDYSTVENPDRVSEVMLRPMRAGTAHGLGVWFDATLAEGIQFSNAPGRPRLIYGEAFFPWLEPVALVPGDTVTVTLRANLVGDDYVWSWDTSVVGERDPRQLKAEFKQSTFFGQVVSPSKLRKLAANCIPTLNDDALIDRLILQMMGDAVSLGDIARHLALQHPKRFASWQDALTRVGELSAKYAR